MAKRRNTVHTKWTAVILLISQCLAATDLKPVLNQWVENNAENFPTLFNGEPVRDYYIEKIERAGPAKIANVKPFSMTTLKTEHKFVSDITLDFNGWFHQKSEIGSNIEDPEDPNYGKLVSSASSGRFDKYRLKGPAEFFDTFELKSFHEFTYAFQDIQAKFIAEKAFDGKHKHLKLVEEPISLTAEGPEVHGVKQSLTMQCFTLNKLTLKPGTTLADADLLMKTKVDLYISLGQEGQEGLIFLDRWTVSETRKFCPYDYFLLNTVRSQLLFAADEKNSKNLEKMVPIGNVVPSKNLPALPGIKAFVPTLDANGAVLNEIQPFQWYYFNPIYDYDILVDDPKGSDIFICDVAANCFSYEFVQGKGFVLDSKIKQLLGNTPFVRFSFPENLKLRFKENDLKNQILTAFAKRSVELHQTMFGEDIPIVFAKDIPKNITIPLGMFDARFMQVDEFFVCTAPVEIIKAYIGETKLDLSFLPRSKTPHFRTKDFFFAEETQIKKLPDVTLTVVSNIDGAACALNHEKTKITFNTNEAKPLYMKTIPNIDLKHKDNQVETLIVSDWIHFNHDTSFKDNTFLVTLNVESKEMITEAMKKQINVRRLIIGNGFYDISRDLDGPTINIAGQKIVITEDANSLQTLPQIPIGTAARLGYYIQLPNYIPDNPEADKPRTNEYTLTGSITIKPANADVEVPCVDNALVHQHCKYEESTCLSTFDGK